MPPLASGRHHLHNVAAGTGNHQDIQVCVDFLSRNGIFGEIRDLDLELPGSVERGRRYFELRHRSVEEPKKAMVPSREVMAESARQGESWAAPCIQS